MTYTDTNKINLILKTVKEGGGRYWTSKIARITGLETEDLNGGNRNWKIHDTLEYLEGQGRVKSKKLSESRNAKRFWRIT